MCSCDGTFPTDQVELMVWLVVFNIGVQAVGSMLVLAFMYYWSRKTPDEP